MKDGETVKSPVDIDALPSFSSILITPTLVLLPLDTTVGMACGLMDQSTGLFNSLPRSNTVSKSRPKPFSQRSTTVCNFMSVLPVRNLWAWFWL